MSTFDNPDKVIPRTLQKRLLLNHKKYPILGILGPRQSGKTTIVKATFPQKSYVSLEDLEARAFALEDPKGFLENYPKGAILDEVQRTPELFSYIQNIVDEKQKPGMFILTGSQNFSLMENISQSLAGRIALHTLLPFSWEELPVPIQEKTSLNKLLFTGGYPRIYDKKIQPTDWLSNYVQTYLERDVRTLKNIGDLSAFDRFIRMCATRSGQILNLSSLGDDCGIKHNTAKAWISVLEASYILFQLPPHFKNFNKRLRKSPKLYFYDSGLLCHLLGIQKAQEIETHPLRGAIFETFIFSELWKGKFNQGKHFGLYYWQDRRGKEIDCILDLRNRLTPIEIKSGKTITPDYFKNLSYWNRLSGNSPQNSYLIYAGKEKQKRKGVIVLSWDKLSELRI